MTSGQDDEVRFPLFETADIDQVPHRPGIYVWFLKYQITNRFAETSSSFDRVADELVELGNFLRPADIHLTSSKRFSSVWRSEMNFELAESFNMKMQDNAQLREKHIRHLNTILSVILPVLYIGKADNLYRRLRDHQRALEKNELFEDSLDAAEVRQFADRVDERQIDTAMLRFTYFEYPDSTSHESVLKSNATIENHINRILRPILGER